MLGIFVAAQKAHDGLERVRKERELSGAALPAPGTVGLKYDRRGEDTIESTCKLDTSASRHISRFVLAQ